MNKKSLILNFNIQKCEFCAQIQINNLQFTVGNLVLVFLGLWRGVHPQRLPSCLQGRPLDDRSIDSACVLEKKRGTKKMHYFHKSWGGRLRGERLSYLSMYLLYVVFLSFSQKIFSLATLAWLRFILNLKTTSMQFAVPTPFIYIYIFNFLVSLSGYIPDCQLPKFTKNTHKNCTKLRIKCPKIVCGGGVVDSGWRGVDVRLGGN